MKGNEAYMVGANSRPKREPHPVSAFVLIGRDVSGEDRNITRILDFFGIAWEHAMPEELSTGKGKSSPHALVASAKQLEKALDSAGESWQNLPAWLLNASAVYVYGFEDEESSTRLLRLITGDQSALVQRCTNFTLEVSVAANSGEICGPMSGLQIPIRVPAAMCTFVVPSPQENFRSLIDSSEGILCFTARNSGVEFFVSSTAGIVDIDTPCVRYFDVKEHFCESVPFVFFLKRTFPNALWGTEETSGCLIVDDPPLHRRYGFLDYREVLELMRRHKFTTTVAFIPWNWWRNSQRTVDLFRSEPFRFSLAVHGCDHTGREFAITSPALLHGRLQTANARMDRFEGKTNLKAERIMVFPQGVFSAESARALKLNGFTAAVNTEIAPVDLAQNATTIADLWDVAILKYGTFPIYTRRYIVHGIENFAFDGLLGKPCLIAAHHDVFKGHGRELSDVIDRLNSLTWNLQWKPLGEAVRQSFRHRVGEAKQTVQMFSGSVELTNPGEQPLEVSIGKQETDGRCIEAVWLDDQRLEYQWDGECLRSSVVLPPGERKLVRVTYQSDVSVGPERKTLTGRSKVAMKRYLSEVRDNYLSRNPAIFHAAQKLKRLIAR